MADTQSGISSSRQLLGFSRAEWALPYAQDPAAATKQLAFFDIVTGAPGGLVNVGAEALLALALISPDFARRVAAGLATLDPGWRARAEAMRSSSTAVSETTQAQDSWSSLLTIIDAASP